jgi:hypothetical protein
MTVDKIITNFERKLKAYTFNYSNEALKNLKNYIAHSKCEYPATDSHLFNREFIQFKTYALNHGVDIDWLTNADTIIK